MTEKLISPDQLIKLSVSKTKTFLNCKKQYKFTYIEKFPRKTWDFHLFGTFCHKVLEEFHIAYMNGSSLPFNKEMSIAYKTAVAEYGDKMSPESIEDCKKIIHSYLKKIYKSGLDNIIGVEKRFNLPIGDSVMLNGAIDRIQIDKDGVVHVADYKSTKDKKYLVNDFFQLLTYAFIMISEDPSLTKIRTSYIMLRHDFEYITEEFKKEDILKIKEKYIDYADKILKEDQFLASPSPLCKYCDHLERCEEGRRRIYKDNFFGETNW
jgi:RecB family exonuclease